MNLFINLNLWVRNSGNCKTSLRLRKASDKRCSASAPLRTRIPKPQRCLTVDSTMSLLSVLNNIYLRSFLQSILFMILNFNEQVVQRLCRSKVKVTTTMEIVIPRWLLKLFLQNCRFSFTTIKVL